jgi:hypothetical protein
MNNLTMRHNNWKAKQEKQSRSVSSLKQPEHLLGLVTDPAVKVQSLKHAVGISGRSLPSAFLLE